MQVKTNSETLVNNETFEAKVPTGIGLRSSIADALATCVPVWKIKKTAARKATQEVCALADHVLKRMEITQ